MDVAPSRKRWAGAEDWMGRKRQISEKQDMKDFVTYSLVNDRPTHPERVEINKGRQGPRKLGWPENAITSRREDLSVYMCGESNVTENGSTGTTGWEKKYRDKIGGIQKTSHSWWKRSVAQPVRIIEDCVKHVFKEHNQEADHLANQGAEGKSKKTIEGVKNTETWKVVRGYCDSSEREDGSSGCKIFINAVDSGNFEPQSAKLRYH